MIDFENNEIVTLIELTKSDKLIWKKISPDGFQLIRETNGAPDNPLVNYSNKISYSIERNEGNFFLVGHDIRFTFTMTNIENDEVLLTLNKSKYESGNEISNLETLYNAITEQHERKIAAYFNGSVK